MQDSVVNQRRVHENLSKQVLSMVIIRSSRVLCISAATATSLAYIEINSQSSQTVRLGFKIIMYIRPSLHKAQRTLRILSHLHESVFPHDETLYC